MSDIPCWLTQLRPSLKSLNSATTEIFFFFKTNKRHCFVSIFSKSLCWKTEFCTSGAMWFATADFSPFFGFSVHHYPDRSSYPPMTWNRQNTGTGTSPGCWCTGRHHRHPGTLHTHRYLWSDRGSKSREEREKINKGSLPITKGKCCTICDWWASAFPV